MGSDVSDTDVRQEDYGVRATQCAGGAGGRVGGKGATGRPKSVLPAVNGDSMVVFLSVRLSGAPICTRARARARTHTHTGAHTHTHIHTHTGPGGGAEGAASDTKGKGEE